MRVVRLPSSMLPWRGGGAWRVQVGTGCRRRHEMPAQAQFLLNRSGGWRVAFRQGKSGKTPEVLTLDCSVRGSK